MAAVPAPQLNPEEADVVPGKPVALLELVANPSTERLSMPPAARIAVATLFNASAAFGTGFYASSHAAGLQFLAENSHRMPKSEKGWFIYQRYKNNYKLVRGMQGGVRRILQWSPVPIVFLWTESMVDEVRGGESKDLASTVVAGVVTGGLFSIVTRQPWHTASRTLRTGFKLGLLIGACEDVFGMLHGRHIGYNEALKRMLGIGSPSPS